MDEFGLEAPIHEDSRDDTLDADDMDAALFAAAAEAGGAPWDASANVERRKLFWR
ncbi:Imm5 family immunity protein [Corallococcus terminator]|uniref:Immunity protein Imm5 domain-containing protein n=1 Tax=Corallococcus terminator TaxID=2316733 RepID=A0A3A8J3E2_9BACT|nr:Imm5 family immunity protein [Corallococcus terminator]RKG86420.1 hypothetical protein D7V88_17890 [Corallococcus terminator]